MTMRPGSTRRQQRYRLVVDLGVISIILGLISVAVGAALISFTMRDGSEACYNRAVPGGAPDAVPESATAEVGAWPVDLACRWDQSGGGRYLQLGDDWSMTVGLYGGGILLLAGVCVSNAGRTKIRRSLGNGRAALEGDSLA